MHPYNELFRAFITQWIKNYRKTIHFTQERMAEKLRISVRSYSDLENGLNSFSGATLIFFVLFLPEPEVLRLRADFRTAVDEEDNNGAA